MRTIRWYQFYTNAELKYGTLARLRASNGQLRVSTLVFQFKVILNSVTDERRHNLLCVALATHHSNQCKIQQ